MKADFTGTFNKINNLQFWRSTDFSPATGLTLKWELHGTTDYIQPTTAASTVAADAIPTADPGAENVYIGGTASGELTAAGLSDYIVLQLQTTTAAAAGDTSLAEFTFNFGTLIAVMLYEKLLKFGEHLKFILRQSRAKPTLWVGKCRDLTGRISLGRLWESPNFMVT